MQYEKPTLIDLANGARRAAGARPLMCWGGSAASLGESCGVSPNAGACSTGTAGGADTGCHAGTDPSGGVGDCNFGTGATYCASGTSGNLDPSGCQNGFFVNCHTGGAP